MLIESKLTHIKSSEEVIRSVCYEFENFTIDQMDILKYVFSEYLLNEFATFTRGKSYVTKQGNTFIEKRLINEGIKIYDGLRSLISIELHVWGRPIKKCILYVKAPVNVNYITPKHIRQCIINITKKINTDIYSILSKIENVETRDNYFVQDIAIWDGDFTGQYDFGVMKVDFGKAYPNRSTYKLARCYIKYIQYRVDSKRYPAFSFIERTSKIYLSLLQCFLRFSIYDNYEFIEDIPFCPSHTTGICISVNRNDVWKEYITDFINNMLVPNDVSFLFSKYDSLSEEEKGVYFNAINAYCEGMKNEGAKAISYYVICLETIASYEAKMANLKDINKIDMIYSLLQTIFPTSTIEHQTVESMYSIRSAYVHNGIANNDFLDEIFMKSMINNEHCKIIERMANYTLILWLERI